MIRVVDYGVGNVGSVHNMLRKLGAPARVSHTADQLVRADKLILPGIGHFGRGMDLLTKTGLIPVLEDHAMTHRKPVLGICLGMQMMTRGSEESDIAGLGWVEGFTRRFPETPGLRVPHMGWNTVRAVQGARLFDAAGTEPERFYFVHSYSVGMDDPAQVAASCLYGVNFAASFEVDNLFGVQFHPEKSHLFGMALLRRFVAV